MLEEAIALAGEAHVGQRDKVGGPYILHPLRVMLRLQGETEQIVGILHDVVEGAADKSYGVQVAKLAGLPPAAVERAREVLTRLEQDADGADALGGLPLFSAPRPAAKAAPSKIDKAVAAIDIDDLSPRAALDLLYELKAIAHQTKSKET